MGHLLGVEGSEQRLKGSRLEGLRISLFESPLVGYVLHKLILLAI